MLIIGKVRAFCVSLDSYVYMYLLPAVNIGPLSAFCFVIVLKGGGGDAESRAGFVPSTVVLLGQRLERLGCWGSHTHLAYDPALPQNFLWVGVWSVICVCLRPITVFLCAMAL